VTPHREALQALERLKTGAVKLDSEQYLELLEAVEQVVHALVLAPSGADPVATGLWYNHERSPALARLAAALAANGGAGDAAGAPSAAGAAGSAGAAAGAQSDAEVLRALHRALLERASR